MEERRLQSPGRERDLVHLRIEIRVHSWRRHEPFISIDRLSDFCEIRLVVERTGVNDVARPRSFHDGELGILTPDVGVSDLLVERCKLGERLLSGTFAHPLRLENAVAHYRSKIRDHFERALLRLRRESDLHVFPAKCVAKEAVRCGETASPARLKLASTSQRRRKREVLVNECAAKIW